MRLHVAANPQETEFIADWTASRIPAMQGTTFPQCTAMAVLDNSGQIIAGIVFTDYSFLGQSVQMSIAADTPRWLTKGIIRGILSYPFMQLGCGRITAITATSPAFEPTSVSRFLTKFGFALEGVARRGLGNAGDAALWGLLSTDWIGHRFNQERRLGHGEVQPEPAASDRPRRHRKRTRRGKHRFGASPATNEHGGVERTLRNGQLVG